MASGPVEHSGSVKSFKSKRCNIVVLGKAGSGKSTVANKILRYKTFDVRSTLRSVTGAVAAGERAIKGPNDTYYSVKVVDTMGFMDIQKSHKEILDDIKTFFREKVVEGVSLVLYVVRRGRITIDEVETIDFIKKKFHKISPMLAMVITHCEGLETKTRESTVREFQTEQPFSNIASFMEKGILTVGFPDTSTMKQSWRAAFEKEMEGDVQVLHDLIYKSTKMHLTSEMFFEEEVWAKVQETQTKRSAQESGCSMM